MQIVVTVEDQGTRASDSQFATSSKVNKISILSRVFPENHLVFPEVRNSLIYVISELKLDMTKPSSVTAIFPLIQFSTCVVLNFETDYGQDLGS